MIPGPCPFGPGRRANRHIAGATVPLLFGFGTDGADRALLPWLAQNVSAVFTILLSLVLIALVGALVYALWRELRRNAIVLDEITVPRELAERGYTPAVVTERLLFGIGTIQAAASTQKPRRRLAASAQQLDIQLPGGQLSIKSLARYFRHLLMLPEQHLGGEIVRDGDEFLLRLRRRDDSSSAVERVRRAPDVETLLTAAAEEAMRLIDPYVLASYLFEQELPGPEFPRTLETLEHIAASRPDETPWAFDLWGLLLLNRGENEAALEKLQRGFAADPALQSPVSEELMEALVRLGRTDEGVRILESTLATRRTPEQRTRVGWCYVTLGRPKAALKHFRRAVAGNRRSAYAMHGLAFCLWRLHRYRDAVRGYETFIRLRGPGWTGAHYYICTLIDVGRGDEAVQVAERLHAEYPNESAALAGLAVARLHQHRYDDAARIAGRSTKRWALRSLTWYAWGSALLALGEPESALAKFQYLLRKETPAFSLMMSSEYLTGSARALAQLGRHEEAFAKFAEAERLDAANARNHLHWGEALLAIGRADEGAAKTTEARRLASRQGLVL
jgi:tetratricopeptide (TPR) repeat protein